LNNIKKTYNEFPHRFWMVVLVTFVDRVGGTMLFPFFALYFTEKFNVGMTEAGIILGLYATAGMVGSMIGGALTDRFGRRVLIIFGLVFSAISSLAIGLTENFVLLYPLAVVAGLLSDIGSPARTAMIGDLLPEEQRQEGFGILRVVANMAWIIGPTVGGIIANSSYLTLFIIDAVASCLVAVLFYRLVPETQPEMSVEQRSQGVWKTFKGYSIVLRDKGFIAFLAAGILMGVVYSQMYNSLSVYLRDVHAIKTQGYGFLMTTSAITVILLQFRATRIIKYRPPFVMMALGTLFYMVGFSMFGLVSYYWLFALAIVIITFGEMIVMPISSALAINFAPLEMRGRYTAVFDLIWWLPAAIGPGAAGLVLDNLNPNLLWYIGGAMCAAAALGFYYLHLRLGMQKRFVPAPAETELAPV
jgi:MFS family permease